MCAADGERPARTALMLALSSALAACKATVYGGAICNHPMVTN